MKWILNLSLVVCVVGCGGAIEENGLESADQNLNAANLDQDSFVDDTGNMSNSDDLVESTASNDAVVVDFGEDDQKLCEANQISIHNSLHKPKSFIGTLKDLAQDLTMLSSGFLFSEFKKHFLSFNINYLDPSKYTFFSKNQIGKDKLPEPDFTTYNSNKDLLDDFGPHPNADLIDFSKIKTYNKNPNLVLHTVNLVEEFNKYNKIQKERNKLLLNVDNTAELEDLDIVYKCEKHKVLTKDGFVLLIFRIYAVCVNHEHNKYEFCDLNNDYSDDDSEDDGINTSALCPIDVEGMDDDDVTTDAAAAASAFAAAPISSFILISSVIFIIAAFALSPLACAADACA